MWENIIKNKNAHLGWLIFILFLSLVLSLSYDLSQVKDLVEILSFALSITSLVVGVFAIFQSLFSSEQISSQMSNVSSSLANIKDVSLSAKSSAEDINVASNTVRILTENLKESMVDLGVKLESSNKLLSGAGDFVKEVDAPKREVESPKEKIQEPVQQLNSSASSIPAIAIGDLSNGVLIALVAAVLLVDSRKLLDFSKIFTSEKHKYYVYGALVVMRGCGIVNYKRASDIVSVESYAGFGRDELKREVERRISQEEAGDRASFIGNRRAMMEQELGVNL